MYRGGTYRGSTARGGDSRSPSAGGPGRPGRPRKPRLRPRWGRIALFAIGGLVVLALVLAGVGYQRIGAYDDKVNKTDIFADVKGDRPAKAVDGATNVLLLGSDSRDGTAYNPNDPSSTTSTVKGERADTLILMHIPASQDKAYLISIPRDTYVTVPDKDGNPTKDKINAAYSRGGLPRVVKTVEGFTGVRIDNVVKVDFNGFKKMTDAVGGVDVSVDKTVTDPRSKRTFKAGVNHLDGNGALDYVRQRYGLPNGDFDRVRRQQIFIRALMSKATSTGTLTNPVKLNNFASAATESLTADKDFELFDFAWQFKSLRSDDLVFMTSPVAGTDTIDGQSVVLSDKEKAAALYDAVKNDKVAEWLKENPQKPATGGR